MSVKVYAMTCGWVTMPMNSLLMGEDSQKSAGEMIEPFKRNRLLVLGVAPGSAP